MSPARLEGDALLATPLACAVVTVINERGYERASVAEFLERSGFERAEFERQFSGKAEVTLLVMEAFIGQFRGRVERAYGSARDWPESLRAAAYEAARWLTENPRVTYFGMVSSAAAGDMPRARREEIFRWCAGLIDCGRSLAPDPASVPAAAPLIAIGAIAETLRRQQEGGVEVDTVAIVPQMMYAAVRPYLGEEAARRELALPPPPDLAERVG